MKKGRRHVITTIYIIEFGGIYVQVHIYYFVVYGGKTLYKTDLNLFSDKLKKVVSFTGLKVKSYFKPSHIERRSFLL